MTNGALTEVRDRISVFLAGRGWLRNDPVDDSGGCWSTGRVDVFLIETATGSGELVVESQRRSGEQLVVPADSPDLLERLGKTLDGLGV